MFAISTRLSRSFGLRKSGPAEADLLVAFARHLPVVGSLALEGRTFTRLQFAFQKPLRCPGQRTTSRASASGGNSPCSLAGEEDLGVAILGIARFVCYSTFSTLRKISSAR
jgi:hypothetical protein